MPSSDSGAPSPGLAQSPTYEFIMGSRLGWVTGFGAGGLPLIDFDDNPVGTSVAAQVACGLEAGDLLDAMRLGQRVVLVFTAGDPRQPVLLGLVRPPRAAPLTEVVLDAATRVESTPGIEGLKMINGELLITAANGITLRCGEASVTLLPDGTVRTRGARIESRADGLHLVRGGKVEIN